MFRCISPMHMFPSFLKRHAMLLLSNVNMPINASAELNVFESGLGTLLVAAFKATGDAVI